MKNAAGPTVLDLLKKPAAVEKKAERGDRRLIWAPEQKCDIQQGLLMLK